MSEDQNKPAPIEKIVETVDPQLISSLKPEQREKMMKVVRTVATSFQGPLPPPQLLAEYDRLIPNGAERLMKLLEDQTKHRHAQESKIVHAETTLTMRGQWIGTVLCIFFGAIGAALAILGHDAVAGVLFGTTILGLVIVFVLGRHPHPQSQKPEEPSVPPNGKRKNKRR